MKSNDCWRCYYYYADGDENGYNTRPYCHFDGEELPWLAPCEDEEHAAWVNEEQ